MLDGFKKFILRGNVVDMAVGVVIGAAFGGVVTGLTKAFLNPLIKLVAGGEKFSSLQFTIRNVPFPIDDFINATISFILIAAAVYFCVVLPINTLVARMHKNDAPAAPTTRQCPECLSDIPIEAKRCSHCTQLVMGKAA
jgi:large conductance mechanosensitive channel